MKIHSAFSLQVATATIPSLILLAVVPVVRSRLDLDTFAGFAVIVSAIGLLSVLDGGMGRAATYFVSMTGLKGGAFRARAALLGGLAVGAGFAMVVMVAATLSLAFLDGALFVTAHDALYVLLLFYPAFVAGSILKGALEGQQRFALLAALQLTHGALIGIAPLFVITRAADLSDYAWVVGAARISLVAALLFATGMVAPGTRRLTRSMGVHGSRLFHYSKWLFFSNIVGLCIIFADRFVIAGYFDSSVVAAYVLPMELIARGQILVGAFCSVIFPKLVMHIQRASGHDLATLIGDTQGLLIAATLTLGFVCIPLMEPLMGWWLGHALAPQAATIALVGIVGLALVSGSSISMLAINGMGHTRQVAVLHMAELPLYLGLLYLAVLQASLYMLLAAWLIRLSFDLIGMEVILRTLVKQGSNHVPLARRTAQRWMLLIALICALLLLVFLGPTVSSRSLLYWSVAGVAVSVLALTCSGFRLRASILTSPVTSCQAP
jgi:O-antigen/teichoic acid export membrane protein